MHISQYRVLYNFRELQTIVYAFTSSILGHTIGQNEKRESHIVYLAIQTNKITMAYYICISNKINLSIVNMIKIILKGLAQAKIIKKSVILFRVLNMTI